MRTRLAIRGSFAALLLLCSACGGKAADVASGPSPVASGGGSGAPSEPAWTVATMCVSATTDTAKAIFEALAPSPAADYLSLRAAPAFGPPSGTDAGDGVSVVAERGTRCASASDAAACEKRYRALVLQGGAETVSYTRGDEVAAIEDVAQAMKLLGEVDTPEAAFFVAGLAGFTATCSGEAEASYRPADGGLDLVTQTGGCGAPVEKVVVRVLRDGTVLEVSRTTIGPESGCGD